MNDTTTEPGSRYMFDNANPEAARQLDLLAAILDQHTTDVLTRAGIRDGWRCLDLGSGAGSIAHWMADRVAPNGSVTALDADPRHIPATTLLHIRTADIRTVELTPSEYDLIHARLLLMHLPQRETVLRRLVTALRPGGVLVVSDWDCSSPMSMLVHAQPDATAAFRDFQRELLSLGFEHGASMTWATRVPGVMASAGLVDITGETYNRLWYGDEPGCLLHASNSRQREPQLLSRGLTEKQLAVLRAAMADPSTMAWSYPMITTTGRRPIKHP